MKSGIIIRVGAQNWDIVDLPDYPIKQWAESLDEVSKIRTIIHLVRCLR